MPYMETRGARIKKARNEAGLSQGTLGKRLGVTHSTIGQWERNETTDISYSHMVGLCRETGKPVEYFIGTTQPNAAKETAAQWSVVTPRKPDPNVDRAVSTLMELDHDEIAVVLDVIKLILKARHLRNVGGTPSEPMPAALPGDTLGDDQHHSDHRTDL